MRGCCPHPLDRSLRVRDSKTSLECKRATGVQNRATFAVFLGCVAGKGNRFQRDLALIPWAHNPKVGGSNPPPATNLILGLQAKLLFVAGAKRGIRGCFGGLFHFTALSAGRSAICTTLLLAARFDSIMASP